MGALKDHYARHSSDYLAQRRALGDELSDEAHRVIEEILSERGEPVSPAAAPRPEPSRPSAWVVLVLSLGQRVIAFLTSPQLPLWKYCLVATPVALVPSVVLLSTVLLALRLAGVEPRFPVHPPMTDGLVFFAMVVLTPIAETLLLALGLCILGRFIRTPLRLAATSAILWGLLHGLVAPIWFIAPAWSFFVFSSGYIAWRGHPRSHAFAAAAVPHMLINLVAATGMRSLS